MGKLVALTLLAATAAVLSLLGSGTNEISDQNGPILTKEGSPVESWVYDAFQKWSVKHKRLYRSSSEKAYRLNIFRDNILLIKQHNKQNRSFTLAINKFADLTQEEFKAKLLTLKPELKISYKPVYLSPDNLPDAIDWRDQGIVSPVKDQRQCGSCWAFSAIASVEGLAAQQQGHLTEFSEQQLVDCSKDQGNMGCNGGWMDNAFRYVEKSGIQTEDSYQYAGVDQKCQAQGQPAFKITGLNDVPANDNDQLAAAVAQRVVSVGVEADKFYFQFYRTGVVDDPKCGTELDHGVAVVGYGTDSNTHKPFWLVKNSWGSDWGDNGYIRILKETGRSEGICGIAKVVSYPTAQNT
eukprot:TRINITY_DN541_c0_g1_i1.p1 TRINITY_DN541_c0_g1~~TRINITY_DN541_c0_g1_i1.p1  ORF type:complete len:352 (+),score=75.44 TRINITY_DN541_c0_g1_i1:116-1171(+)